MIIALLTDFGVQDNFVGVMKGVMLTINPGVQLIDITHEVKPQNIRRAAFLLWGSYSFFPKGTIFLVVVDPGVGSKRSPLAIKTKNYYFVGPDNGVLSLAAEADTIEKGVSLENKHYFLKNISSTFHGRDIFAPSAAYLSRGVPISSLGKDKRKIKKIFFPQPQKRNGRLIGELIYVDRFGNLITNIKKKVLYDFLNGRKFIATIKRKKIKRIYSFYACAEENEPFFVEGSFGFLEVSFKNGNAQSFFSVKDTENVKIIIKGIG
jgi:hypothetical protein